MSTKPLTQNRSHQLAALYTEHHATLQRHIAHRVNAPRALIEDACQTAWTRLAARHDIAIATDHARGWLHTVALREAWALAGDRQLTDPLGHPPSSPNEPTSTFPGPRRRSASPNTSSTPPVGSRPR